jgi:hypothetical protein
MMRSTCRKVGTARVCEEAQACADEARVCEGHRHALTRPTRARGRLPRQGRRVRAGACEQAQGAARQGQRLGYSGRRRCVGGLEQIK